jgi:hypothetical protein
MTSLPPSTSGTLQVLIALAAGATGLAAAFILALPPYLTPNASLTLSPQAAAADVGNVLVFEVIVDASVPVNAYTGEIVFDNQAFTVERIDYNTSIADLWVEEPWYSRAENSIYFAGGTTDPGGFTGVGSLMTIYLRATEPGFASVSLQKSRILLHDGIGTDATLTAPIDARFSAEGLAQETVVTVPETTNWVSVAKTPPSPDLNGDGLVTFADMAIFMLYFGSENARYDFNQDGSVGFADMSILAAAR